MIETQAPWAKACDRINRARWDRDPKLYRELFEGEIKVACLEHAAELQADLDQMRIRAEQVHAAREERNAFAAEVERLRKDIPTAGNVMWRDAHDKAVAERDALAAEVEHWQRQCADLVNVREALGAEVERLKEQMLTNNGQWEKQYEAVCNDQDRLATRVERLREALELTRRYSLGHGVPLSWYMERDKALAADDDVAAPPRRCSCCGQPFQSTNPDEEYCGKCPEAADAVTSERKEAP